MFGADKIIEEFFSRLDQILEELRLLRKPVITEVNPKDSYPGRVFYNDPRFFTQSKLMDDMKLAADMRGKQYTQEEIENIIYWVKRGRSITWISEKVGRTPPAVRAFLWRLDHPTSKAPSRIGDG